MTTRPTVSPLFATDATFSSGTESGLSPRLDPGAGFRAQGVYPNRRMPARWWNFLGGLWGDWIDHLDQRTRPFYNVLNYGADPTATSDSKAAFQAAHDDAFAAGVGAGVVVVPGGTYKLNSGFSAWKEGVSLWSPPGGASLYLNHATDKFFQLSSGVYSGAPTVFSGLNFEGLVANSGEVFFDATNSTRSFQLANCGFNSGALNLRGTFFDANAGNASSRFQFENLNARLATASSKLIRHFAGACAVRGGKLTLPTTAAWNVDALMNNGGRMIVSDLEVDMSGLSGGTGSIVYLPNSGSPTNVTGCQFRDPGSGLRIFRWSSNAAQLTVLGNKFINCLPYDAASGTLSDSGGLDLLPSLRINNGSATTVTISDGYASVVIESTRAGTVQITLPNGHFAGQEFKLTYYNNTGGPVTPALVSQPVTAVAVPSVSAGSALSSTFVWEDQQSAGDYRWVQKGGWGVGVVIV